MARPVNKQYAMHFGFGKEYDEEIKHLTQDGKHHGHDYLTPKGTEIYNPTTGIYYQQGYDKYAGYFIITKFWRREKLEMKTYRFLAFHLSRSFMGRKKIGDKINQDEVIALSGDSGCAKGHPHFHGEIQKLEKNKWIPIDPSIIFGKE